MPSIKPPVEKFLRSKIVYKITCPGCQACYVGQTVRHLQSRFREHQRQGTAITQHIDNCNMTEIKKLNMEDIEILASTQRGSMVLLTLEAIWIRELSPSINTKDEFRLHHEWLHRDLQHLPLPAKHVPLDVLFVAPIGHQILIFEIHTHAFATAAAAFLTLLLLLKCCHCCRCCY